MFVSLRIKEPINAMVAVRYGTVFDQCLQVTVSFSTPPVCTECTNRKIEKKNHSGGARSEALSSDGLEASTRKESSQIGEALGSPRMILADCKVRTRANSHCARRRKSNAGRHLGSGPGMKCIPRKLCPA